MHHRPIGIFQHASDVPPGYFELWLRAQRLPYIVIHPYRGDAVPMSAESFSGLCFMGGPMSANDRLPWIDAELRLIRAADTARVPVIGHCLGGQLLAKSLGARVVRYTVKEIGWGEVNIVDVPLAREWLGDDAPLTIEMFQWHGDAFELPAGARNFLASHLCERQAYIIDRGDCAHIGMQFHCEMTPEVIRAWLDDPDAAPEIEEERRLTGGPGVKDAERMMENAAARCARMNELAARIYSRWGRGLRGG